MFVTALELRDFRSYTRAHVTLGAGLTVVHGPNGAGKTNLLEALYFGLTARSCRTSNEREVIRYGQRATRVQVTTAAPDGEHHISVGFEPAQGKRIRVDGATVERLNDSPARPLVSVFLPARLELVQGPPALRRAHLDQVIAALWPARVATRASYRQALAQRNALLARIRAGAAGVGALDAWDGELARHALELIAHRAEAVALLAAPFAERAGALGLGGVVELAYRPRSRATTPEQFASELLERREAELERGFSGHGPHRDELALLRDGRELRAYGSQGEQRLAVLALLLAERAVLGAERGPPPLMLLDDVMSELDPARRELLAAELCETGQSVLSTTDLAHVPGAGAATVTRLRVADGAVLQEAVAA